MLSYIKDFSIISKFISFPFFKDIELINLIASCCLYSNDKSFPFILLYPSNDWILLLVSIIDIKFLNLQKVSISSFLLFSADLAFLGGILSWLASNFLRVKLLFFFIY